MRNPRALRANERSCIRAFVTPTLAQTDTSGIAVEKIVGASALLPDRLVLHVVNRHRLVVALVFGQGVTHEGERIIETGGNVF